MVKEFLDLFRMSRMVDTPTASLEIGGQIYKLED
jgi:hypothetical protein